MIQKIINKIAQTEIVKNISILASGVVIGYAINMMLLPVISRVYTPAELGRYDLIVSVGNVLVTLVCLALMIAIMVPNEDETAIKICKIINIASVFGASIFAIVSILLSSYYRFFESEINYNIECLLLAIYVWSYNQQGLFYAYVNRKKMYKVLFWNPIIAAITNSAFSILFGYFGWGATGYLLGTIASYMICILHMRVKVNPYEGQHSIEELWMTLKNYKSYPLVQLPANMILTVSTQIPIQFLGRIFGVAALGGYTMACKILSVPVSLLATPVNRVYYREAAERNNRGENIGRFCFSIIEKNIKIAIIPIGALIIFGEPILTFVLGRSWKVAGTYISILGILYLFKYCSSCISGTLVIIQKQKVALTCSVWMVIHYTLSFLLAMVLGFNLIQTVIFYMIADCIYNFVLILLTLYYSGFSIKKYLLFIIKYILGSAAIIYGIYFMIW